MSRVRNHDEVKSRPLEDNETFDDSGYVLVADQGGDNKVHKATTTAADYDGTNPVIGVNYVDTIPDNRNSNTAEFPESGEIDVQEDGYALIKADAEAYTLGQTVYVSQTNAGHVNGTDTTSVAVGEVHEAVDYSSESAGEKLKVVLN